MRAPLLSVVLVALTATPSIAAADRDLCEKRWPYNTRPAPRDSQTCLDYFVKTYLDGYDVMFDPPLDHEVLARFGSKELNQMARNIAPRKRSGDTPTINDRLKEFFEAGARQWAANGDVNLQEALTPFIDQVFAGKRLDTGMVEKLSYISLVKLRNAPYARHGRPFKHPDLQHFYYTKLNKRAPNPDFNDAMLDKVDAWNLALILKVEKAKARTTK